MEVLALRSLSLLLLLCNTLMLYGRAVADRSSDCFHNLTGHKSATVIPSYTFEATHAAKLDDQNERDRIVSRKLLADISPPGMWTATDDEDRTSNKRRLLTADDFDT